MDSGDEILLYVLSLLSAIIVKIKKKKNTCMHMMYPYLLNILMSNENNLPSDLW